MQVHHWPGYGSFQEESIQVLNGHACGKEDNEIDNCIYNQFLSLSLSLFLCLLAVKISLVNNLLKVMLDL